MNFLVIQTAFIGDAILVSAALEKLHAHYPAAHIDLVVRKGNEALYEEHPYLGQVYVWDKKQGKYRQLWRLAREIRETSYDYVFNFQRFAASGLLTLLVKARRRYGFKKNPLSWGFSHRFPHQIGNGQHETERNHQLLADVTDKKPAAPKLYPPERAFTRTQAYKNAPYICIAPTSVWATKQYPPERWVELIEALPPLPVYVIGGPDDYKVANDIARQAGAGRVHNLCGELSLLETAALMRDARMNYVNDSAPLHIASAMQAPVTAIFCSTVPEFGFYPLGADARVVQTQKALSCRPCGIHGHQQCPEGHFDCAYSIALNELLAPLQASE